MDGLTLLARLRETQAPVKAITVSAYGDMANLRTAMNRGAFDFVTKPVDMQDLEVTIRKTLDDIAKLREIERLKAAAERAGHNLSRYFSPNIVEMLAAPRAIGRCDARPWRCCSPTSSASLAWLRAWPPRRSSGCCANITSG
jgi:DNA-binding NtrC family response regulator